jgi:hypothetical protein
MITKEKHPWLLLTPTLPPSGSRCRSQAKQVKHRQQGSITQILGDILGLAQDLTQQRTGKGLGLALRTQMLGFSR